MTFDPTCAPRQFSGGMGNLNYLITVDGAEAVLRRPPLGPIPPGANDMKREHTVLNRLWSAFPMAPRSLFYCADEDVLGAHFLIMEIGYPLRSRDVNMPGWRTRHPIPKAGSTTRAP